jgi:hypothetical protein
MIRLASLRHGMGDLLLSACPTSWFPSWRTVPDAGRGAHQRPPLCTATLERPAYFSMTRTTPSAYCGRNGPAQ